MTNQKSRVSSSNRLKTRKPNRRCPPTGIYLDEYLEEHKNSKLMFCWYTPKVGIVFSPSDHNGIYWAGRLKGIKGKGKLPAYILNVVERIAKEKGLA